MNKIVAFIIKTKKGKFGLHMSEVVHVDGPDHDPVLHSKMVGPKFDKVEDAQAALESDRSPLEDEGIEIFLDPIESSENGISWYSELQAAKTNKE